MNILIAIGVLALCYFIVYGICRLVSGILVALKIPWAAVLISCVAIIIKLRQYSFLNYVVVLIAIVLLVRLMFMQVLNTAEKAIDDKEDYRQTVGGAYACLLSFLVFGTLYANLNYILTVHVAGLSFEEYKDAGIFTGKILSSIGFGPLNWVILILAAVAFYQVSEKTGDLEAIRSSGKKKRNEAQQKKSELESYYTKVMHIPVAPRENTVDANRAALKQYFLNSLCGQEEKAEKLTEVVLNIASLEISEPDEILEALVEDSGLPMDEILKCFPKLESRSE